MEGIIIQMGQFNPLHRMHKRIADDAIKHYPGFKHHFGIAYNTCDKGVNSKDQLDERVKLMEGYNVKYYKSGLFVDVCLDTWIEDNSSKIIFACGEDTMYRFFRDWDKYYTENHPDEYLKRYTDYADFFDSVEWYVSRRACTEKAQYEDRMNEYMKFHDNVVWSKLDLDDISSTKIRNNEVNNDI